MPDTQTPTREPFGIPDGSIGELRTVARAFVNLDTKYGGIARVASDAKVRVLVGRLGAGKSLYLRRMQNHQHNNPSTFAIRPSRNLANLTSDDLARFARMMVRGSNTENWKLLWLRAIIRSALTYVRHEPDIYASLSEDTKDQLRDCAAFLHMPQRHPRGIVDTAKEILVENESSRSISKYLESSTWTDLKALLSTALLEAGPLFMYVDAIDDNYRYAPTLWTQCQRGLFYTVMDLLRDEDLSGPLHVVVAIRDITLASIRASEHSQRYLDFTHISLLNWKRDSMRDLLTEKLAKLDKKYFSDPDDRSIQSWVGFDKLASDRPRAPTELVETYLIRHTRLVPRDLVVLGNDICRELSEVGRQDFSPERLKQIVHHDSQRSVTSQIALCANQIVSDMLPDEAIDYRFESNYLQPSEYTLQDAANKIRSCIELSEADVFSVETLQHIEQKASELFEKQVHLRDILWQHGLLGTLDRSAGSFFSLTNSLSLLPPPSKSTRYVWNPIVFDLDIEIDCVSQEPIWPA